MLVLLFGLIFFGARSCIANQQTAEVRKYVTGATSLMGDSTNIGLQQVQPVIEQADGDPAVLDGEALTRAAEQSRTLYQRAMDNEEVPAGFEDAHHYLVSALGVRAETTERLQNAANADPEGYAETLAAAVEDYKMSDGVIMGHYLGATRSSLEEAERGGDGRYLREPDAFMDYGALGVEPAAQQARSDPNVLHGVEITGVEVAGQPLAAGGAVVLTGQDEPVFTVTITNGGEAVETGVPVKVTLDTAAERQAREAIIGRIEPGGLGTAEVAGFIPGALEESAQATVEVGPVEHEDLLDNNTLTGWVTFGL